MANMEATTHVDVQFTHVLHLISLLILIANHHTIKLPDYHNL